MQAGILLCPRKGERGVLGALAGAGNGSRGRALRHCVCRDRAHVPAAAGDAECAWYRVSSAPRGQEATASRRLTCAVQVGRGANLNRHRRGVAWSRHTLCRPCHKLRRAGGASRLRASSGPYGACRSHGARRHAGVAVRRGAGPRSGGAHWGRFGGGARVGGGGGAEGHHAGVCSEARGEDEDERERRIRRPAQAAEGQK
mmetsp:Transcript_25847/g.64722  ORF Transcript_25847/g.64722 Transcript_25847/m.64722 type:complete len:200 (-) Transcript_25847:157-756(-)